MRRVRRNLVLYGAREVRVVYLYRYNVVGGRTNEKRAERNN